MNVRAPARHLGCLLLAAVAMLCLATSASAASEGGPTEVAFHEAGTADSWFITLPESSGEEPVNYLLGPKAATDTDPTTHGICLGCDINEVTGYYATAVNSEETETQWRRLPGQSKWQNTGRGFAPHTSPSPKLGPWPEEPAFNARSSEEVWTGSTDLGLPMESGTSPDETGGHGESSSLWVAIAGRSGDELVLWHAGGAAHPAEFVTHTGLGMEPGTNPSITELANREVVVAFQAKGLGQLGIYRSGAPGWFDTGLGLDAGSSPSVTEWGINADGYLVGFQAAGSQHVGVYQSGWEPGRWLDSGMAIQAGSSPCITTRDSAWDVAFQGSGSHDFWTWDSATGGRNWGWVLGEHSSPVIDGDNIK